MSVTPTPSDNADDFDIYADLPEEDCHSEKAKKITEDYENVKLKLKKVESELEKLQVVNEKLMTLNKDLSHNISVLFQTASAEIKRKDAKIAELHRELDNLAFRRTGRKRNGNQPTVPGRNLGSSTTLKPEQQCPTNQSLTSTPNLCGTFEVDVLKQNVSSVCPPLEADNKCAPEIDVDVLKSNIQHSIRNATDSVRDEIVDNPHSETNSLQYFKIEKYRSFLTESTKTLVEESKVQSPIKTIPKKRKIPEYSTISDENTINNSNASVLSNASDCDKVKEVKAPLKKSVFERLGTNLSVKKEGKEEVLEEKSSLEVPIPNNNENTTLVSSTPSDSSEILILRSEEDSKLHETVPIILSNECVPCPDVVISEESTLLPIAAQEIANSNSQLVLDVNIPLDDNIPGSSAPKIDGSYRSENSNLKCSPARTIEETSEKIPVVESVPKANLLEESEAGHCHNNNDIVEETNTLQITNTHLNESNSHICVQRDTLEKIELSVKLTEKFQISPGVAEKQENCSNLQISVNPPLPIEAPKPLPPLPLNSPPPTPIKTYTTQCATNLLVDSLESPNLNPNESVEKPRWSNENLLVQCPFKPRRRAKSVVLHLVETANVDSPLHCIPKQDKLGINPASSKVPDCKFKKTPLKKTDSYENRLAPDSRPHHSQRSVYGSRHLSSVKSYPHLPERRSPSELLSGRSGRIERLSHQDKIRVRLRDRRSRSLSPLRRRTKQDSYRTRNAQHCDSSRRGSQRVQDMTHERCKEQKKTATPFVQTKHPIVNEKEKEDTKRKSTAKRMADLFGESSPEPEEKTTRLWCSRKSNTKDDLHSKPIAQPFVSQNDSISVPLKCGPDKVAESSKINQTEGVIVIRHKPRTMIRLSNSDGSSVATTVIVSKSPNLPVPESKETDAVSILKQNNISNLKNNLSRPLYFREQESRKRCNSDNSSLYCEFSADSDESLAKSDSDDSFVLSKNSRGAKKRKTVKNKVVV